MAIWCWDMEVGKLGSTEEVGGSGENKGFIPAKNSGMDPEVDVRRHVEEGTLSEVTTGWLELDMG